MTKKSNFNGPENLPKKSTRPDIFIFAGELSGDLHGGALIESLRKKNKKLQIIGVGGPKMRAAGMECLILMEEFEAMGFFSLIPHLPRILKHFFTLKKAVTLQQPRVIVLIDYAEMNMRLAGALRKAGYTGIICQYIGPTVWKWRPGRVELMAKWFDLLLVIFPFEPPYFAHTSLRTVYVGNPLINPLKTPDANRAKKKKICALFPGSRKQEITRHLPYLARVAKRLLADDPSLHFAISVADPRFTPLIKELFEQGDHTSLFSPKETATIVASSTLALSKMGTITLELARYKVPTIAFYDLNQIERIAARFLIKKTARKFYSLPSIMLKEEVFPELVGDDLTDDSLYLCAKKLLTSEKDRKEIIAMCERVIKLFGKGVASENASREILNLLA